MKLAVVLFNLGGPDSPEAVEPFLRNLFSDPAIIALPWFIRLPLARFIAKRRAPVARKIYDHLGGKSPIFEETRKQADALETALSGNGVEARAFVAMRCWHPFSDGAARAVKAFGPDRIVLLPLYPQYSASTTASSVKDWRRAAKAAKKPVVVSMGTYGASGGYWIASQASAIVAEPSTLTGSIGVFGGKFAIGPALARFGVDMRHLGVGGDYAGAFSLGQEFTPAQRAAFARWMDRIYDNFVARVAEGRKLPESRVREIAKGHVWTGAQAKQLGLIDQVGGFYDAVDKAKALAGLTGEVRLKRMSPTGSPIEALQKLIGVSAASIRAVGTAAGVLDQPQARALITDIDQARLRGQGALVLAPVRLP